MPSGVEHVGVYAVVRERADLIAASMPSGVEHYSSSAMHTAVHKSDRRLDAFGR